MDEFCQTYKGWAIYFSPEQDGFYATKLGRQIGYFDAEAEAIDEIDADLAEQDAANRGPFAYLGAR